jgi:TP901 family phage tail tape measure protein
MASGNPQMNLTVVVEPVVDRQALNRMAATSGADFASQFKAATSRTGQPLGRISGQVDEFEKSMAAANARVLAFGASAGSIYLVQDAFRKLVSSTIEVEKALADINAVLDLGQTELKNFSTSMFKAASATGQTFQTASKVALEFARHGVSASETMKRMVSAMQLMRISGLDAAQSVNAITAAINSFNKEGLTSEDVVNRLTAVDTKFAVSAQDLAQAIGRVGSTAVDAGVKFNQLLGMVTAVQTVTSRGGAVIGNALKSIFTRLARPEVLADLEAVGVSVRNASGQIRPMDDIMKKLAERYDHLSYSQKSFVSEAVGGVYQINILKALLADLARGVSTYEKAQFAAGQSTGFIDKRMSTLNETISAKLNTSLLQATRLFANFGQTVGYFCL